MGAAGTFSLNKILSRSPMGKTDNNNSSNNSDTWLYARVDAGCFPPTSFNTHKNL